MDVQRNFLFIILCVIVFLIWQVWENNNIQYDNNKITDETTILNDNYQQNNILNYKKINLISVKSDVLHLSINMYGGDIYEAYLLKYAKKLHSKIPFSLLETKNNFIYQAQSGIIGKDGPDNPNYNNGLRPLYYTNTNTFIMQNNKNELRVPLMFIDKNGVIFQKTFILKRGKYCVDVEYKIINNSMNSLNLVFFGQLKQTSNEPKEHMIGNSFSLHSYRGAAYSSDLINYKKYSFDDIHDENLNVISKNGWIAMLQQYFVAAWIPNHHFDNVFYSDFLYDSIAIIGYKSYPITVSSHSELQYISKLWIGPELQSDMSNVAKYLDLTLDNGWLWFISQPLFNLLKFINGFVKNWGISIIIITFIVRVIMYPLTKAQYTSIAKMRILQPKIMAIKEKLGNNNQRISQEMMELYKTEKVNPLGGCLPLIIQMPIFLALYYMLISSVELRHAKFVLWIQDLSAKDPYYILPLFMGLTMYFIQRISPNTITDPIQNKIMSYMPFIFIIFFLWFPSGLVLYYIISNIITIIQQQLIYHGLEKVGLFIKNK